MSDGKLTIGNEFYWVSVMDSTVRKDHAALADNPSWSERLALFQVPLGYQYNLIRIPLDRLAVILGLTLPSGNTNRT